MLIRKVSVFLHATFHTQVRWHSLAERTQNGKIMIKRNFSMILVIIAMILNILNFGYSNISIESFDFWLSFCATIVLIGAIVKIIINENKEKKKSISD
ncbi:hypothetical protein GCM10022291_32670 [Postechiella marina]|uniref:Uncharacterized protein n=2 Tax=Postechiella marina TaxID=943941 RepID=A0ABP8CHM7_9FLAO